MKIILEVDEKLALIRFILMTEGRDDDNSKLERITEICTGEQEDE